MRLLIDMNLSPRWAAWLGEQGHVAEHWASLGAPDAGDVEIMRFARNAGSVVLTNDLDFGTLLALSADSGPSVLLIRAGVLAPEMIGGRVIECLARFAAEIGQGALVVLDDRRSKVRLLPISSAPQTG